MKSVNHFNGLKADLVMIRDRKFFLIKIKCFLNIKKNVKKKILIFFKKIVSIIFIWEIITVVYANAN